MQTLSSVSGEASALWIVLGTAAGIVTTWFLTTQSGRLKAWRERRRVQRQASLAGIASRVSVLEENAKTMSKAIEEFTVFIKGSQDPFTGETQGGLLAFMRRIDKRLDALDITDKQ
jgi:hypothetical protein